MTEEEWDACTDPMPMLEFLRECGDTSDRKLRLFAAACCRRAWQLLDVDGQAVVEASERFADGTASEAELKAGIWASRGGQNLDARAAVDSAAVGAWRLVVAYLAAAFARQAASVASPSSPSTLDRERAIQAGLLRCVLGPLPFRTPRPDPRCRTPLVLSLALAAYEVRVAPDPECPGWLTLDSARLLVLADALEEVGCTDTEIIEHLRRPGPHSRGCWPVDLCLGKS